MGVCTDWIEWKHRLLSAQPSKSSKSPGSCLKYVLNSISHRNDHQERRYAERYDILKKMAQKNLVSILVSVTSLNEDLRRVMEPRTTTGKQRLKLIRELSNQGIRMGVMLGPMIPDLMIMKCTTSSNLRVKQEQLFLLYIYPLNGSIKILFHDWLYKNFRTVQIRYGTL
jgi:DNA repair photolyase